jgi:hypothetical protein
MATYDKYMKEVVSIPWSMVGKEEEDETMSNTGFKFSPQQIKNLKIYVLDLEDSKRAITLRRGIAKLNSNKPLNVDEAGSVKDFCLDVLDGNSTKFKALMG